MTPDQILVACLVLIALPLASLAEAAGRNGAKSSDRTGDPAGAAAESFAASYRGKNADTALDQLLAHLTAEIPEFEPGQEPEAPHWKAVRWYAGQLTRVDAGQKSRFKRRSFKETELPAEPRVFPLPGQVTYRFGQRDLLPLDKKNRPLASQLKRRQELRVEHLTAASRFEQLAHGCLPETELALTAILRDLDVLGGADDYARFLESWRNPGPHGDESFYEALDRAAGSPEAVFFFDAMLADFVQKFGGKEAKGWPLGMQHDRLHDAFLTYRQYRGLVEAMAYAAVLPPNVSFPGRLSRYDYSSVTAVGAYSFRHMIDILAASHGGDYAAALDQCKLFLRSHPLPDKLWGEHPMQALFVEWFDGRVAELVEIASTDELLEEHMARSGELAKQVAELSRSFPDR